MNDQELKILLKGMETPRIDESAKKRAIKLAISVFDEETKAQTTAPEKKSNFFTQGILDGRRPIRTEKTNRRSNTMKFTRNKVIFGGLATVSIAVIGVLMIPLYQGIGISDKDSLDPMSRIDTAELPRTENLADRDTAQRLGNKVDNIKEELATTNTRLPVEQDAVPTQKADSPVAANRVGSLASGGESNQLGSTDRATGDYASTTPKPVPVEAESVVTVASPPSSFAKSRSVQKNEALELQNLAGIMSHAQSPGRSPAVPPGDIPDRGYYKEEGRDRFEKFATNPIKLVSEEPLSTFSVDVDTSSYSFVRHQLNNGVLPQKDSVRLEEMINYFDYEYPLPESKGIPFKASVAVTDSPWNQGKKLMHIGIKGYAIEVNDKPRTNLVFLLDVSGSMNSPDKLPLVKQSMNLLLSSLQPEDTVGIVVYAGAAGKILDPTPAKDKEKILQALNRLEAGGSTAGAQGIKLAYQLAEANFDKKAINRIVLATDGDFNIGITNPNELQGFVERKKEQGIFLSVLGFGAGNYHDQMMQVLAQNGNGVAAYIDTLSEARKVLVDEATSTLFPIAKDVKIQMEFNPVTVAEYRLLGYETRRLKREDFNNDAVDAGDIGAGHTVTAIYEITPVGSDARLIDDSRYSQRKESQQSGSANEYAFLKIRYKLPDATESKLITQAIAVHNTDSQEKWATREVEFASAVAGFAQLLKGGRHTGKLTLDDVIEQALRSKGEDTYGYRSEFVQLVRKAKVAQGM